MIEEATYHRTKLTGLSLIRQKHKLNDFYFYPANNKLTEPMSESFKYLRVQMGLDGDVAPRSLAKGYLPSFFSKLLGWLDEQDG